jgi:signal transduction histidine kinase/ActR/RegA family two-component response regulator
MVRVQGTPDAVGAAVLAQKIRTLFRQSPRVLLVNPVNAAIVGAVLWHPARGALIVAWVVAMALAAALRALVRAGYVAAAAPVEQTWARRYTIATGLQGALWGAGSVLLYVPGDQTSELILVFVLGGMTAGSAGTLATYLPAFFAYAAPAILPLAVRFIFVGGGLHIAMGALGTIYGAALVVVALNTNHAMTDAFRLRFENEALLARLSRAQAELEEANRTLEARVAERSLALKRQDEALQEARRMESVGLLAGGIAHDFNNLLTVILGNAALLQDELDVEAEVPLAEIRKAAERAASLVSQLLAMSRRQARAPRVLDLNAVVSDAQRMLARLIGEAVELVVSLRPAPLPTLADPGQLDQVIVNLATNARDAMPRGGTLTIETDAVVVTAGSEPMSPGVGLAPGAYVVLAVRDTGVGMDAETRRRAFHPFFTTKEIGHGTGLGLATVNGIVEQSGGRVVVESEPERGSCFRVFLPRAETPVAAEAARAESTPHRRRTGTVLLVEDEPMVRDVITRALEGAGLSVLVAGGGEQALACARDHEGPIDVLVTDVVMARMDGRELATRLADERPGVRVLLISGYGAEARPAAGADEGVELLEKPFTPDALVESVARLLDAGPTPSAPSRGAWSPIPAKRGEG